MLIALRNSMLAATLIAALWLASCGESKPKMLPILGPYSLEDVVKNGILETDTIFSQVRPFSFYDQDSNIITEQSFEGKVYVTDFFFTSCPTICPKMKQQLLRVYEEFKANDDVVILSHSIDTKRDSVARLNIYAKKLGIETQKWHLVTGNQDSIYSMAKHYLIAAQEDKLAPGGYAHSGQFLLIDKNRQIRGAYDGTKPEDVDEMILDIKFLLSNEGE